MNNVTEVKEQQVQTETLPAIAIRDVVLFPYMPLPLSVDREKSIAAIDSALADKKLVAALTQKKASVNDPKAKDLYDYGVVSKINQSLKMPDGTMRVFLEGVRRIKVRNIVDAADGKYFKAEFEYVPDISEDSPKMEALMRNAVDVFEEFIKLTTKVNLDAEAFLKQHRADPSKLADTIAANATIDLSERLELLQAADVAVRLEKIITYLTKEIEILSIEQKIQNRVKGQIEQAQKEHYLNEQMKAIQKELHQNDDFSNDIAALAKRIKAAKMSKEAKEAAEKELGKLSKMMPMSPESTVSRSYIEWLTDLPWSNETKDTIDLKAAKNILNEDHFGLAKPKDRVLEYMAVCKLTKSLRGPVLCFVGPPGVGKTSIAKSIARAMGRKFVRMSLGGVHDEAEIRGHRRTYIASMPGRIIQSMKKAGSVNPVFLLDEIDKMASDYKGDPASALLELLDPEQNKEFTDNFLDVPYDVSKVMFIATANTLWGIPATLRDRMEVIEFSGYTHNEKISIAEKYLLPKQLKAHGLPGDAVSLDDKCLDGIIRGYTREAGVRNLDREIASLCRRVARKVVEDNVKKVDITAGNVSEFLGVPKFINETPSSNGTGVATGLAWTENGGEILSLEIVAMDGKGMLTLTGQLGDVMKESAQTAFSYVRSKQLVPAKYVNSHNFHLHVPEGAIPKDGPSAGITMATAIASLFTGRPVKAGISMTGELTLTGRVLAIGGLKEKVIASYRDGFRTVLFPKSNLKDLEEIPAEIKDKMKLVPVESMDEVLRLALSPAEKKSSGRAGKLPAEAKKKTVRV